MESLLFAAVRVSTSSRSTVSTARYCANSAVKRQSASRQQTIEMSAPPRVRSLKSSYVFGKMSSRSRLDIPLLLLLLCSPASAKRVPALQRAEAVTARVDDLLSRP
eukprot:scaffold57351_cov50-Phaeocystis_antarctica.AAC.4